MLQKGELLFRKGTTIKRNIKYIKRRDRLTTNYLSNRQKQNPCLKMKFYEHNIFPASKQERNIVIEKEC